MKDEKGEARKERRHFPNTKMNNMIMIYFNTELTVGVFLSYPYSHIGILGLGFAPC
jgi:hypothetical protein